ncbi:MAG: SPOR domain-containing protein [Rhodoferax sp.]|jgi:DedD protein|nr:SPOR domain-containing protein [Rhodoferax sp.]
MAFFKFRKNGAEQSGPTPAPESLEVLRKRARHRLIGAAALVLLGVVGFPMLFDSQPRPVAVDIAIDIPDKAKAAPLTAAPASTPVAPEPAAVSAASSAPASEPATALKPAATPVAAAPAKAEPKAATPATEPKADSKSDAKAAAKVDDKAPSSAKAQALLDGKEPASSAAASPRYAVQVGAFSDAKKAQDARVTLEKAGIKTYTQVVTTPDGKRTRVRAGPWDDKAEAEKTAEKIKKLKLPAAVLTL